MPTDRDDRSGDRAFDVDVVVVGGGPAGCSAAVFTARYGLETVVFDRGPSSLARCAYLENYLGFPAGIDVETFTRLARAHVREVGGRLVDDLVESVTATPLEGESPAGRGFRVRPQERDPVTARFVIAATKYDGEYLRGLDDDEALFETEERDGTEIERFDPAYPDADGRTPVDGLYVAGPLAGCGDQAIIAAGHGATVARSLLRDIREAEGYWGQFADRYDWVRRTANRREEWADPDRWIELFEANAPDGLEEATVRRLAEAYAADRLNAYVDAETVERRTEAGHRRLAASLDDERLLEAIDDEAILEYAAAIDRSGSSDGR